MPESSKVFVTERDGDTLIVVPHGDGLGFRYADVQIEASNIHRVLGGTDVANLAIDLEQLDYFGSEVIGVFITMAREASNRGGKTVMSNATKKMRHVLQSMKLFRLWPHFSSRVEALAYVQQKTAP